MSNLTIDQKIEKTCGKIPLWKYWLISGVPSTILTLLPIIWSSPYSHDLFSPNFIVVTVFAFAGLSMAYTMVLIFCLQSTVDCIRLFRWFRLKTFGDFIDQRVKSYLKNKGLGKQIADDVSSHLPITANNNSYIEEKFAEVESRILRIENKESPPNAVDYNRIIADQRKIIFKLEMKLKEKDLGEELTKKLQIDLQTALESIAKAEVEIKELKEKIKRLTGEE